MPSEVSDHLGEEHPKNHLLQQIMIVVFFLIWGLDSFIFLFTTFLRNIIPLMFHIIIIVIGIAIFIIGFLLMQQSHAVFHQKEPKLVITGLFAHVRHPMYLGTILSYLGAAVATLSLAALVFCIVIFVVYNYLATYEEKRLEEKLGDEYCKYRDTVPKWVPR